MNFSKTPRNDDIPNFSPRFFGIGFLLFGIVIVGLLLVGRFNDNDLSRDIQGWREKLNLIAESRTSEVNRWVNDNFKELRMLAENPSLQLYLTEMEMVSHPAKGEEKDEEDNSVGDASQKAYLRNLLLFTAQRSGYSTAPTDTDIPADVKSTSKSALALIDNHGVIAASTRMSADTQAMMLDYASRASAGQETLIDIRKDKDGSPYIGFIVPVYSVQGEHTPAAQIGRVVGIRTLDNSLFGLLKHPGITEKTLESILVRPAGAGVEYISPLQDSTDVLGKVLPFQPAKLTEARLVENTGDFSSDLRDYRDRRVLATSRLVAGTTWSLIVKIDRQEALAGGDQLRARMEVLCFLVIAVIVLLVFAIWWRAHSRRALLLSAYFKRLAGKALAQKQLLRLVADHQLEPIYIVDEEMVVHFANMQAAREAHIPIENMIGKTLWDILGAVQTKRISQQCKTALTSDNVTSHTSRITYGEKETVMRSVYIPLHHIPVSRLPDPTPGVMVVEQDISEVVHERENRLKTLRQVIDILVSLVDKRDPFAAHHSKLVSQIAYEVALEMELDSVTAGTTSKAGSLMNIGKITVPPALLTKSSALSPEEKRIVLDAMNEVADLLEGINFDGPVVGTLRQWQEKWDGTGPMGLKGEDILISARIIAVANAFVGMISPRSWRSAIPVESATTFLMEQADTHFDRRVVIALANFIENHHGREWIEGILEGSKKR